MPKGYRTDAKISDSEVTNLACYRATTATVDWFEGHPCKNHKVLHMTDYFI
jgi:hypothetical protein